MTAIGSIGTLYSEPSAVRNLPASSQSATIVPLLQRNRIGHSTGVVTHGDDDPAARLARREEVDRLRGVAQRE